jgi:hypothetical protein
MTQQEVNGIVKTINEAKEVNIADLQGIATLIITKGVNERQFPPGEVMAILEVLKLDCYSAMKAANKPRIQPASAKDLPSNAVKFPG